MSLNGSNNKTPLQNRDSQFIITSSKNLFLKRLKEGIERMQISMDSIGKQGIQSTLLMGISSYKRVLKRGIRIRLLTEMDDNKTIQKNIQKLKNNSLFEIRYLPYSIPINTMIGDRKEVNLNLTSPSNNTSFPSLWTNNAQFAKIVTVYFEELWMKSR